MIIFALRPFRAYVYYHKDIFFLVNHKIFLLFHRLLTLFLSAKFLVSPLPLPYHYLTTTLPLSYHYLTTILPLSYHYLTTPLLSSYSPLTFLLLFSYFSLTFLLLFSYFPLTNCIIFPYQLPHKTTFLISSVVRLLFMLSCLVFQSQNGLRHNAASTA